MTSFFTSQEDLNVISIINTALKQRKGAAVQAAELPADILLVEHAQGHLLTLARGCAGILLLEEDPRDFSSPALILPTQFLLLAVAVSPARL